MGATSPGAMGSAGRGPRGRRPRTRHLAERARHDGRRRRACPAGRRAGAPRCAHGRPAWRAPAPRRSSSRRPAARPPSISLRPSRTWQRGDLAAMADRLALLLRLDASLAPVILSMAERALIAAAEYASDLPRTGNAPRCTCCEATSTGVLAAMWKRQTPIRKRCVPCPGAPSRSRDMTERTLILIKPDGVQRLLVGRLIERYEQRGLRIVGLKLMLADRATAEAHYAEHRPSRSSAAWSTSSPRRRSSPSRSKGSTRSPCAGPSTARRDPTKRRPAASVATSRSRPARTWSTPRTPRRAPRASLASGSGPRSS